MGEHLNDKGEFQTDKYAAWCPAGFVPLKLTDRSAWPYLWGYAQVRRAVDAAFADDLETALRAEGYEPPDPAPTDNKLIALFAEKADAAASPHACSCLETCRSVEPPPHATAMAQVWAKLRAGYAAGIAAVTKAVVAMACDEDPDAHGPWAQYACRLAHERNELARAVTALGLRACDAHAAVYRAMQSTPDEAHAACQDGGYLHEAVHACLPAQALPDGVPALSAQLDDEVRRHIEALGERALRAEARVADEVERTNREAERADAAEVNLDETKEVLGHQAQAWKELAESLWGGPIEWPSGAALPKDPRGPDLDYWGEANDHATLQDLAKQVGRLEAARGRRLNGDAATLRRCAEHVVRSPACNPPAVNEIGPLDGSVRLVVESEAALRVEVARLEREKAHAYSCSHASDERAEAAEADAKRYRDGAAVLWAGLAEVLVDRNKHGGKSYQEIYEWARARADAARDASGFGENGPGGSEPFDALSEVERQAETNAHVEAMERRAHDAEAKATRLAEENERLGRENGAVATAMQGLYGLDARLAGMTEALRELVSSLPKCDVCGADPATKAFARGGGRYCDVHGGNVAPDYPRAAPLRRAVATLAAEAERTPPVGGAAAFGLAREAAALWRANGAGTGGRFGEVMRALAGALEGGAKEGGA